MKAFVGRVSSRLSLVASFSWAFLGNVVYAGCQWGMLVALARLGSPEMVGQFALGLAITAPVVEFANLRLRLLQATDARSDYEFDDYLGLQIVTAALALAVVAAIAIGGSYQRATALVVLALGLAKAIENMSDTYFGVLQRHQRMDRIGKSMALKGVASLVALSAMVYLTGRVLWGVLGLVASWALVLVLYDMPGASLVLGPARAVAGPGAAERKPRRVRAPRFRWVTLARLARLAMPLGLATMLMALNSSIPRYFVERRFGEGELGVFAALAYFHRAGTTVANALGDATSPSLSREHAAGEEVAFRGLLLKTTGAAVLLGAAGVVVAYAAGPWLLTLFYGPTYARQGLFVLLMVASGLAHVGSVLMYGLTAARHLLAQLILYVAMTAALMLACTVLVPYLGLEGAAAAMVVSRGVQVIGGLSAAGYVLWQLHRRASGRGSLPL